MKKVNNQAKNAAYKLKTNVKAGPGRGAATNNAKGRDPDAPLLMP